MQESIPSQGEAKSGRRDGRGIFLKVPSDKEKGEVGRPDFPPVHVVLSHLFSTPLVPSLPPSRLLAGSPSVPGSPPLTPTLEAEAVEVGLLPSGQGQGHPAASQPCKFIGLSDPGSWLTFNHPSHCLLTFTLSWLPAACCPLPPLWIVAPGLSPPPPCALEFPL